MNDIVLTPSLAADIAIVTVLRLPLVLLLCPGGVIRQGERFLNCLPGPPSSGAQWARLRVAGGARSGPS